MHSDLLTLRKYGQPVVYVHGLPRPELHALARAVLETRAVCATPSRPPCPMPHPSRDNDVVLEDATFPCPQNPAPKEEEIEMDPPPFSPRAVQKRSLTTSVTQDSTREELESPPFVQELTARAVHTALSALPLELIFLPGKGRRRTGPLPPSVHLRDAHKTPKSRPATARHTPP